MKKLIVVATLLASSVVGLAAARSAEANTFAITTDGSNYTGANGGGEFKVTTFSGATLASQGSGVQLSGAYFETFCIEINEHISVGTVYDFTVGTAAVMGGNGGGNPDPLGAQAALLYSKFWDGSLASLGYNYTPGSSRVASATALQLALWLLENEYATNDGSTYASQYNSNSLAQSFVSYAQDNTDANSTIGNVRVLNLTETHLVNGVMVTENRQSQLVVLVPLPPAAWSGLAVLAALGGFAWVRRRRRQQIV